MGPQPNWDDIDRLSAIYWEAVAEQPGKTGHLTANRSISVAKDRETAVSEAIAAGEAKAGLYTNFNMQEPTTVDFGLGASRKLENWASVGRLEYLQLISEEILPLLP